MIALLLILACLTGTSFAKIGVGYKLWLLVPYSFSVSSWDKTSGYGFNATADFGSSPFSSMWAEFIEKLFFFGTTTVGLSFYTLSVSKDFMQDEASHTYARLGAMIVQAKVGAGSQARTVPLLGVGREWFGFFGNDNLTSSVEMSYPEALLFGTHYYF